MMTRFTTVLLLTAAWLQADFNVKDPQECPEADAARSIDLSESPFKLAIPGDDACQGHDEKGGRVRIWRYPHQFQRLAAAKLWKVIVEKGDGDRQTYVLPVNSVVGVFFHQATGDGRWKAYRGTSKNPISLTQPSILFTLSRQTKTVAGGAKQQFLTWDVLTGDAPEPDGSMASSTGVALRADSVWIWQGNNPVPKKHDLATGKAKISFVSE